MFETQTSRKRKLLATTGLGTVMTAMSLFGITSSAQAASTLSVALANTFSRQLSATGNASVSGTLVFLSSAITVASGNFLTFTLPSGMTFSSNPSVSFSTAATSAVTLSTGGSSSQSVIYQTGTTGFTAAVTLTLSGLQVAGLQSYVSSNSTAGNFNITAAFPADAVTASTSATLAIITDAATVATTTGGTATVDVSAGGSRFVSGTGTALFIPLGTVAFANAGTVPNDVGGNSPVSMTSSGGAIAVSGSLSGITTIYGTTATLTCTTAAPTGAFTVTPSTTAGTLSGLSTGTYQVCAIANGSTILSAGNVVVRPTVTTSNSASISGTSTTNVVTYSGNVRSMAYFVGATGGYGSFAYAVNSGATASSALVSVRRNDGVTVTGSLSSLAAGASALYGASDINTAVGSSFLVDASSRAAVTFLFSSSSVNITGLLLNPGGTVTGMGQTFTN